MLFLRDMIYVFCLELRFDNLPTSSLLLSGSSVKTVVELTILLLGWGWGDKAGNLKVACHVM
jgi:hypothetical protein